MQKIKVILIKCLVGDLVGASNSRRGQRVKTLRLEWVVKRQ